MLFHQQVMSCSQTMRAAGLRASLQQCAPTWHNTSTVTCWSNRQRYDLRWQEEGGREGESTSKRLWPSYFQLMLPVCLPFAINVCCFCLFRAMWSVWCFALMSHSS